MSARRQSHLVDDGQTHFWKFDHQSAWVVLSQRLDPLQAFHLLLPAPGATRLFGHKNTFVPMGKKNDSLTSRPS